MKNKQKHLQPNSGFTFIELMVVISIVAIITIVAIISFDSVRQASRDNQRKSDLKNISVALEIYYNRKGYYPNEDYNADGCDSSIGACGGSTSWHASSDIRDLITEKIITTLPIDPLNIFPYIYTLELDQAGEGTPACPGSGNTTCRYVLQALLEKDDCIYTLKGGYGNPNSMDLPSDCSGNIIPTGWDGKSCCAQ